MRMPDNMIRTIASLMLLAVCLPSYAQKHAQAVINVKQTCHCIGCDLNNAQLNHFKPGSDNSENNRFAQNSPDHIAWINCEFQGADLTNADLAYSDFNTAIRGVQSPLDGVYFDEAVLKDANLRQGQFYGASFKHAGLSGSDMRQAELSLTNFYHASFKHADLRRATSEVDAMHGWGSDFRGADFSQADLRGAQLYGDFRGANFTGADLRGTCLVSNPDMALPQASDPNADPWQDTVFKNTTRHHTVIKSQGFCEGS